MNERKGLYFLVLGLCVVVALTALGGGLFHQSAPWYLQWQHQAFLNLCHQIPERSFWINGQPMAVCSRCIGVYSGFTVGWVLLPFISGNFGISKWPVKKIALLMLVLNILDVAGSLSGVWMNDLLSRFYLGGMLGISASFLFTGDFFNISSLTFTGGKHARVTAE